MSAFSVSFCVKGLLLIPQSKVKVMMVVITTPFKSENEFLKDLNRCWLLNKAMDPSGGYGKEYYSHHQGWVFFSVYWMVFFPLVLTSSLFPCLLLACPVGSCCEYLIKQKAARSQKIETSLSFSCCLPSWAAVSSLVEWKSFLSSLCTGCTSGIEEA